MFFRCARLAVAGALIYPVARYTAGTLVSATSERAYINADMTGVRTPIEGRLKLEALEEGVLIHKGAKLFEIENPRFGNKESMSQVNWIHEQADRLEAEQEEASVALQKQEQVHGIHARLHAEGLISRLAFLEEETKLALCRTSVSNKLAQALKTRDREAEMLRQVELQRTASVTMPFDGVAWSIRAKDGMDVSAHEPVLEIIDPARIRVDAFFHERHIHKITEGAFVSIRTPEGKHQWTGHVDSIRSGVGTIPYEEFQAKGPGELVRRRVAVRIRMDSPAPFTAGEFFGVGRNVIVSLESYE